MISYGRTKIFSLSIESAACKSINGSFSATMKVRKIISDMTGHQFDLFYRYIITM